MISNHMKNNRLIVALDVPTFLEAQAIVFELDNLVEIYKVGLQAYTRYGREILAFLRQKNKLCMLDLKLHDIPNTVAETVRGLVFDYAKTLFGITLHASGGEKMLRLASDAMREGCEGKTNLIPELICVTILTSLDEKDCRIIYGDPPIRKILDFCEVINRAGLCTIVCSPQEVADVKTSFPHFIAITPGIRIEQTSDDQSRVSSPREAILSGSNFLVVGRPILEAADKRGETKRILRAIILARGLYAPSLF